jgi:hypothetical protein
MKHYLTCLILFNVMCIITVHAQEDTKSKKKVFSGTIYDKVTLDVLPFSHVKMHHKVFTTDSTARFIFTNTDIDTVIISHIGYFDSRIAVAGQFKNTDTVHIEVLMKPQIYEMGEIDLFSYKTFAEFKRAVLQTDITTKEGNQVIKNSEVIRKQLKNDYLPYSDGYINYRMNQLENGGVVIFSNGSRKGIISAIKKLIKN